MLNVRIIRSDFFFFFFFIQAIRYTNMIIVKRDYVYARMMNWILGLRSLLLFFLPNDEDDGTPMISWQLSVYRLTVARAFNRALTSYGSLRHFCTNHPPPSFLEATCRRTSRNWLKFRDARRNKEDILTSSEASAQPEGSIDFFFSIAPSRFPI